MAMELTQTNRLLWYISIYNIQGASDGGDSAMLLERIVKEDFESKVRVRSVPGWGRGLHKISVTPGSS
ncbi:hypothetical protein SDJN02_25690, partial [Cucurbita argyrosperma subsp. argyrosperma]